MGADSDEDIWLMDETKISELIDDEGDRLMFVFDYLTNRAFFMELKECIFSKDIDEPPHPHRGVAGGRERQAAE